MSSLSKSQVANNWTTLHPLFVYFLLFCVALVSIWVGYSTYDASKLIRPLLMITAVCAVALLFNPRVLFIYFLPIIFLLVASTYSNACFVLLLTALIIQQLQKGKIDFALHYPVLTILVIILICIGFYNSIKPNLSRYFFINSYIVPIGLMIVLYNLKLKLIDLKRFSYTMGMISAIIGFISLGLFFATGVERQLLMWGSTNSGALWLAFMLPITIVLFVYQSSKVEKVVSFIILVGTISAVFVTQTRSLLLSSAIALVFLAVNDKKLLKVLIPILLIGVVIAPILILPRILMMFGLAENADWSSIGRIEIYYNSIRLIPEYFWFGMGLDSFRTLYLDHYPHSFIRAEHPHNQYLRWLFDIGVIGMLGLILITFKVLIKSLRVLQNEMFDKNSYASKLLLGFVASLIAMMTIMLLDAQHGQPASAAAFYVNLALQIILVRIIQNKSGAQI